MEDDDLLEPELVEMRGLGDRPARVVHVGPGQHQEHPLGPDRSFRRHPLEAPPPGSDAMPARDRLHHHEPDIVAVADMAGTGIAEPDEKQHGEITVTEGLGHATPPPTIHPTARPGS